jgi:hypothetical protein
MKEPVGKLLVILTLIGLTMTVSINTACAQTIDEEPTATPTPTPSPTPQPKSGTSVFSVIMSNFGILGLARFILIALGILWIIVILRAIDKNFGKKKPSSSSPTQNLF